MRINCFIKENYLTISLWIMLFFIFWLQIIPQTDSLLEATLFPLLFIITIFPISTYLSENLLTKAIKYKRVKLFILEFCLFSILIGFIFALYMISFSFLERKGYFPPSEYFDITNFAPYSIFIVISAGITINICICGGKFFQENIKLKKTLLEYQLQTLQQQITPHFMFNVLNHIHILMQSNVELASSLLIKYSEILRYQLYNGDKQKVIVEKDIQFLKDFISIEEIRWGDKLLVNCSWKIEDIQKEIPSLLFITFIENAFKYVSKSTFERGYININFEQEGNILKLKVENSKSIIGNKKDESSGLGLKNIKERLEILYPKKYDLLIKETDSNYITRLIINI